MSRWPRVHVDNGVYYLRLSARDERQLFEDPADIPEFERSVSRAVDRDVIVHAFVWTKREARFVVQTGTLPVSAFLHRIASSHSRRINRKHQQAGPLFQRPHEVLIHKERFVLRAVRYVHLVPVYERLVDNPAKYDYTSLRAHLGLVDIPWVTTSYVRQLLASHGGQVKAAYAEHMRTHNPRDGIQLESGPPWWPRGDDEDLINVREAADSSQQQQPPELNVTMEGIIARVTRKLTGKLCVTREEVFSKSRCPRAVRARALITWEATTDGVASLRTVATYLGKDPSTLSTGLSRYRDKERHLFPAKLKPDGTQRASPDSQEGSEGCVLLRRTSSKPPRKTNAASKVNGAAIAALDIPGQSNADVTEAREGFVLHVE